METVATECCYSPYVMMASFMDLHGIQNLYLHYCIVHKKTTCVYMIHSGKEQGSTRYPGPYLESRISSSMVVSLGFQDYRVNIQYWVYGI